MDTLSSTSPAAAPARNPLAKWLVGIVVWIAATLLMVGLQSLHPRKHILGADFTAYWCAAKSLSLGLNPYDPDNHRRFVAEMPPPYDANKDADPRFDHLPFYNLPWSVYPILPLLPLGFHTARMVWLAWVFQCYLGAVYLLAVRPGAFSFPMRVCAFGGLAFWLLPLRLGQVVAPTVLLLVLCLDAWERRRDVRLGLFLVLAVVKPQIAVLPVGLLLASAVRDRRWKVIYSTAGFAAAMALTAFYLRPTWVGECLASPRITPPPSMVDGDGVGPQVGCSLWAGLMLVFGTWGGGASASAVGAGWWAAAAIQAVAAGAIFWGLAQMLWNRKVSIERLLGAGVLATWFLAPYLRYYDLPILCLPLCALLAGRLPPVVQGWLCGALVVAGWLDESTSTKALRSLGFSGRPEPLEWEFHWWWAAVFVGGWWLFDVFWRPAAPESETSSKRRDEPAANAEAPQPPGG